MKINGSLKFDASGLSQIENLRLEKLSSLPAWGSSDVGRLVYVTGSQVIYLGGASDWISLATGGNAANLQAEVDAIEASLGALLNADGSYNAAALAGNLAGSTSVTDVLLKLQDLVAAAEASVVTERDRATAAETALDGRVTTEVSDRTAADQALRTDLDAEVARATAAETAVDGRVTTEVARATAAEAALQAEIDAEETRAGAAETALGGRIDTETAARIAGDEALGGRVDDEAARATAAEAALDGRITTEVSDRTAAVNEVAADLATEVTDRTNADTALGTRIDQEVTRATAEEAAIRGELAAALVGLTWEAPVDEVTDATSSGEPLDGTGKPNGYRLADTASNRIYTVTNGAYDAGEALVDGAAFFDRTADIGYTFNGSAIVPFSGASSFVAGAGLSLAGNTVNVGNTDGSITVTADNIAVSQSVRDEITANATAIAAETTRATTAESGLDDRIDDEVQARIDAITNEVTARDAAILVETNRATAAEAALQAAIDAEEERALAAETAAGTALQGEVTRATAAETALGVRIDDEVTARTEADQGLRTDLEAEVTRATAAEGVLTTAVTAANDRISKMYFLYQIDNSTPAAAAAVHTVDHNLGQSYCNVTVVDATNNVVIPESIVYNTPNQLTVTFNTAIACRVIVMGLAAAA